MHPSHAWAVCQQLSACGDVRTDTRPSVTCPSDCATPALPACCLQVALIVYLAHVGCFVPADEATVGLADRIITRIVSQERLVMQQSTFMIDLTQVATMLRRATSRSLVIIDEFGKVRALPAAGRWSSMTAAPSLAWCCSPSTPSLPTCGCSSP